MIGQLTFKQALDYIKSKNKAAILVTHDIEEAVAMADRCFIMTDGTFSDTYKIEKEPGISPEDRRGTADFAENYKIIWNRLKTIRQSGQ